MNQNAEMLEIQFRRSTWAQRRPKLFIFVLSLITIIALQFYNFIGFNLQIMKFMSMLLSAFLTAFYTFPAIFTLKKNDIFYNALRFIAISYFISLLMAYIFWDQSFILTFRASYSILFIGVFFFICKCRPYISDFEKYVHLFTILYIVLYLLSLVAAPLVLFGVNAEADYDDSRGIVRVLLGGSMFLYLSFFISLNKYVYFHKQKYMVWAIIFFLFIILSVTRQVIIFTFIIGAVYFFKGNIKLKLVAIALFIALLLWTPTIKISDSSILGSLIELTERQQREMQSGEEYIRITEYKYFFSDYSKNLVTCIFGNGQPHYESSYGKWYRSLNLYHKLWLSDVGYAMMFAIYGVFGLVLYILIYYRGAFQKVDDRYTYARLFIIYLICNNIGASVFMLVDTVICTSLCFYILRYKGINYAK